MNGLEEIRSCVGNFICEKEQVQRQIREIEEKRTQLAQQRNEKKKFNSDYEEVNELGRKISELGNQSQEMQNMLDSKIRSVKVQVDFMIDNLVTEGIRKIRIISQEIHELEEKKSKQEERSMRYQLQKQEFYSRFGRMPELSERAKKESELQEKEVAKCELEIIQMKQQVRQIEEEITALAKTKNDLKNGNFNAIVGEQGIAEEVHIEELTIEEIAPIEELYVEDFGEIEELYIEEFAPIEEINIEEFGTQEEVQLEQVMEMEESEVRQEEKIESTQENITTDEIEELARAIIEEIVAEQTKDYNVNKIEEHRTQDIISFEPKEEKTTKSKVIIPLFGQKATISSIVVKIEDGELLYKAQMSDEEEIQIYPSKLSEESVLLRNKQNINECCDIITNYTLNEYKPFDKKVINKIDPMVCELLIECAEQYGYNAQELIYNYAMSFSRNIESENDLVPHIIYNLSYINESNLSKKEKAIIKKISKNAKTNIKIEVIESFSGFRKIKYVLKRIFAVNNVKVLPEAKY